ncbi:MAG: hypothetical protein V3W34_06560 [Phycisphaerae bacterium]
MDTSLLIEQQKRAEYAQPVCKALRRFRFKGTSSYSRLEFKRAWLQRLAYIHALCRRSDIHSVNDVFTKINRSLSSQWQLRHVKTCVDAIGRFLEIDDRAISSRAQLTRLKGYCKHAILASAETLERMVTHEFDGTQCARARERPVEQPDGSIDVAIRQCRPESIQCTVHNFFELHKQDFKAIARHAEEMDKASDELKKLAQHTRLALKDPVHLCDDRNCRRLADALIAVDGKDMEVYAANNDREWGPIATVMKKPLLNPVTGERHDSQR